MNAVSSFKRTRHQYSLIFITRGAASIQLIDDRELPNIEICLRAAGCANLMWPLTLSTGLSGDYSRYRNAASVLRIVVGFCVKCHLRALFRDTQRAMWFIFIAVMAA